jgi:hypothetical protein
MAATAEPTLSSGGIPIESKSSLINSTPAGTGITSFDGTPAVNYVFEARLGACTSKGWRTHYGSSGIVYRSYLETFKSQPYAIKIIVNYDEYLSTRGVHASSKEVCLTPRFTSIKFGTFGG